MEIDLCSLQPVVACPHTVDNVKPASELGDVHVEQVFIGTCTNGRLGDLELVSKMLAGKKKADGTRLLVAPASRAILQQAIERGYISTLLESVRSYCLRAVPRASVCTRGFLVTVRACLSTANRNFKARMGNPDSFVYLASPATAAATALRGTIQTRGRYSEVWDRHAVWQRHHHRRRRVD